MEKIKFTLTRDVKEPRRGTPDSAGVDFFVPEFEVSFIDDLMKKNEHRNIGLDSDKDGEFIVLPAGERIKIPLGVHVILPKNTDLNAANRSGNSTKFGVLKTAELVDEDYRGEIHAGLINNSIEEVKIRPGQAIIQFVHRDHRKDEWSKVSVDDYEAQAKSEIDNKRGTGGFSSTDVK